MGLNRCKSGFPTVTFGKKTTYVFNSASVRECGLSGYDGVCFTVMAKKRIVRFDFVNGFENILRGSGFTKLTVRKETNAFASGGKRMMNELYPIIRPHEERDMFVAYRCPVYVHKDSKDQGLVLYCDLDKKEVHVLKSS